MLVCLCTDTFGPGVTRHNVKLTLSILHVVGCLMLFLQMQVDATVCGSVHVSSSHRIPDLPALGFPAPFISHDSHNLYMAP